ncbi:hypothetical protein Scep_028424 [Stephania cephalantha]|uniref:DUF3700 domain-containing protein n=1 Tax=Stephania cephalantha TaxID=152367 RepID=A0AAP0EEI1_9MAGN
MLAIFDKSIAHAPQELRSPSIGSMKTKLPQQILNDFVSANNEAISINFSNGVSLAHSRQDHHISFSPHRRLLGITDEIYCLFTGNLNNLCYLNKQYGLSKGTNEAMFVIEAYRTLRDRAPYPADQVVKDLDGSFAFVIYDRTTSSLFTALGMDGAIKLYWGIAADGSLVISDDLEGIKGSCGKSFAPFPAGCIFHSKGGVMSFEHPVNQIKAMPRIDSEGMMCGADFKVDAQSRVHSMPRVGSEANWGSPWGTH